MSAAPSNRRAVAEVDFGDGQSAPYKIGNRSIHQFWHLFSSHFRFVLLPPQRRPDSGRVAWTWREAAENRPVTPTELTEVRRRLAEGSRSLVGGMERDDAGAAASLDTQVRPLVGEMIDQLVGQRDSVLAGYVCRTDAGLMVHSWGAGAAAKPYFPDAQQGEISGRLIAENNSTAGAEVALDHAAGGTVTRVITDREGGFRFVHVPPGAYRIQVRDRPDFPEGGLPVNLERESITGLELHAASAAPAAATPTTRIEGRDDSRRRTRLFVWVALLLLLLGGAWWWWRHRPATTASASANPTASGWQSADGTTSSGAGSETRRVGQDGAFTTLEKARTLPKLAGGASRMKSPDGTNATPFSVNPAGATVGTEATGSEGAPPNTNFSPHPKNPGAKSAAGAAAPKTAEAAVAPSAEPEASDRSGAELPKSGITPPTSGQTAAAKPVAVARSAPATSPNSVAQASPSPTEGMADSPEPAEIAPVSGQAAASAASKKKPASATSTSRPVRSVTETPAPAVAPVAPATEDPSIEDAAPAGAAASAKKNAAALTAAAAAQPKAETRNDAELAPPEVAAAGPDPAASPEKSKPASKPQTQPGVPPLADPEDKSPTASPKSAEATAESAESASAANTQRVNATPRSAEAPSVAEPPVALLELAVSAARVRRPEWATVTSLRGTEWKARMVQDVILPTRPVTAAEEKQLEDLRAKLLADWKAKLPEAFRVPRSGLGFTVVAHGATGLVWTGSLATTSVRGDCAELRVPAESSAVSRTAELRDQDRRPLARIEVATDGSVRVLAATGVVANFWISLETAGTPVEWRRLAGAVWPEGWTTEGAQSGPTTRWQWPLPAARAPARVIDLSVVDLSSGWALSRQVTVE